MNAITNDTSVPFEANPTMPEGVIDLNGADDQTDFDLVPAGTVAKVRLTIERGGYNDPSRNWGGGYATYNEKTGAVYLKCKFTLQEGPYARWNVWSIIGLHSERGPKWKEMGASFMKAIINSAYDLDPKDVSPEAVAKRSISFSGLDGLVFLARIDVETNKATGQQGNSIKVAVTKGHKDHPDSKPQGKKGVPQRNPAHTSVSHTPNAWE